jgi:hypothetical protein
MKEYILDVAEPVAAPAQPGDAPEPVAPPSRFSWRSCRSIVLLIVLESIALALLYVALIGFPSSPASAEAVPVAAAVPALPVTAPAPAAEPVPAGPPPSPEVAAEVEAAPSRIVRERGHYVIELHSAGVEAALEMLTKATGATVRGSDVLLGKAVRITRTVTTDSPLEAWQAVFGGVVNFAASCTRAACDVRFVPSGDGRDDQGNTQPAVATSVVARTAPPAAPAAAATEDPAPSEN